MINVDGKARGRRTRVNYKQTKRWIVDKGHDSGEQTEMIQEAAMWIKQNKLIAFPTETVYGLGANALSYEAVAQIFAAKGRPSDNPLIVHIGDNSQLDKLVKSIPANASKLMAAFWPGALTLILEAKEAIAENVTAGLSTVGVRMPSHPVALKLLQECGLPVAAPSANVSGRPSPTTAAHVIADLDGKIDGIVDGGATGIGLESTVLDVSKPTPMLYRPGGVSVEEIEAVIGKIDIDPALGTTHSAPKSPGMKYTHYAPNAEVTLVDSDDTIHHLVAEARKEGRKVAVFATTGTADYKADIVRRGESLEHIAHILYGVLREFDEQGADVIYVKTVPTEGVGRAIMNRLEKAAGGKRV
ncbi:MAG: L-threonylcarbamoyladenylate synthase [Shouchella clausii]|nr:L-threonylcarbamoyladenylate synthase [Shouchella clausii]